METQQLWLLAMSIATPIAGFVGFALQLGQVKKERLENDKLQLEIAALRQEIIEAERRIVLPTNTEVQRITRGEVLFCRGRAKIPPKSTPRLKDICTVIAVITMLVVFVGYLAYDFYRIAAWLATRR